MTTQTCIGFSLKFQIKSLRHRAVEVTLLACKANDTSGMNSDVLLKNKTTKLYFDLLFD